MSKACAKEKNAIFLYQFFCVLGFMVNFVRYV